MVAIPQTYGNHRAALREDVIDEIFQITPHDTPFYNDIGDAPANDTQHGWTTRALTVRQHNTQQEGFSFAGNYEALNLPARVYNITQILAKLPQVSRSMRSSNTIGVADLMADQIALNMKEWKTDCEHALLLGSMSSGSSNATTATSHRRLGGFANVVTTNVSDYGSTATFNEAKFVDLLQNIWNSGGNPSHSLCGAHVKRSIGEFVASSTKYMDATDKQIVNIVNVYESDFGINQIKISRDVPGATDTYSIYTYDPTFFKKAWLDKVFLQDIPKVGDTDEAAIIGELTLEYGNEAAAGALKGLQGHGHG